MRKQVRVGAEHGSGVIPQPRGHDMQRHAFGEGDGRSGVAQRVQGAHGYACRLARLREPHAQPRRRDRLAKFAGVHKVLIVVGGTGELAL